MHIGNSDICVLTLNDYQIEILLFFPPKTKQKQKNVQILAFLILQLQTPNSNQEGCPTEDFWGCLPISNLLKWGIVTPSSLWPVAKPFPVAHHHIQ